MNTARQRSPLTNADAVVREISKIIHAITGVQLGDRQSSMVLSRLRRRMQELGINSEVDYFAYFQANEQDETHELVSLLTTHHTYFFRESVHFDFISGPALRDAAEAAKARGDNTVRVWSAACSHGQEVYTIAMILHYHLSRIDPKLRFEVFGSDVDPKSVAIARNGVYYYKQVKEVPALYLADHWARGRGDIANFVKAKSSIKEHCHFDAINLLNIPATHKKPSFDFIFCRNVFIYFTPEQIKLITQDLTKCLRPNGHLIIGVSESLSGLNLGLINRAPSVYQCQDPATVAAQKAVPLTSASSSMRTHINPSSMPSYSPIPAPARQGPVRVFCVDDSPSILSILKKVFASEHGFEVVGTANNGREAAEKTKSLSFDVMTLDIHMPEMDGITYLEKHAGPKHPPVVMISSVQREDVGLARRCFELGATDYVEKPSLANMAERADEIRLKVSCAERLRQAPTNSGKLAAEKDLFQRPTPSWAPQSAVRVVICGIQDKHRVATFLKERSPIDIPTLMLVDGNEGLLDTFRDELGKSSGQHIEIYTGQGNFHFAAAPLAQLSRCHESLRNRRSVILLFGEVTNANIEALAQWRHAAILAEDIARRASGSRVPSVARDLVPITSFAYMALDYLERAHV